MIGRRKLLSGLLAAPFVVKATSLMPISMLEMPMYGPNGLLTLDMVAKEFGRLVQRRLGAGILPLVGEKKKKQSVVCLLVTTGKALCRNLVPDFCLLPFLQLQLKQHTEG